MRGATLIDDVPIGKAKRIARWMARKLEGKGPWDPGQMEPTKAQLRLLTLIGVNPIPNERYWHAGKALKKAGYRENGIPRGTSWQAAAKMSDEELLQLAKR